MTPDQQARIDEHWQQIQRDLDKHGWLPRYQWCDICGAMWGTPAAMVEHKAAHEAQRVEPC